MTERTTVRLPLELLTRAKRRAAADGRTLTSLIEDGLRRVLTDDRMDPKKKRILPPVSRATGGLNPGVDLTHGWIFQGEEDAAYLQRMKRLK